jgi:hypothetical protein
MKPRHTKGCKFRNSVVGVGSAKKPPVCAAKQGKPFERKGYNQSPDTVHQFGVVVKTSRKCNNDKREETSNFLRFFECWTEVEMRTGFPK